MEYVIVTTLVILPMVAAASGLRPLWDAYTEVFRRVMSGIALPIP